VSGFRIHCRNYVSHSTSKRLRIEDSSQDLTNCTMGCFDFLGETPQQVRLPATPLPEVLLDNWKALYVARSVR
jgi:hypothetical protein